MLLMIGSSMTWLYNQDSSVQIGWPKKSKGDEKQNNDELSPEDKLLIKAVRNHDRPILEKIAELQKAEDEEEKRKKDELRKIEEQRQIVHKNLGRQYDHMVDRDTERLLRNIETNVSHPEPSKSKIVIVSGADKKGQKKHPDRFDQVQKNRREYANYHGYIYQFVDTTQFADMGGPPHWGKVPAVRKAFDENPDAEWVWWLDTDALIMNAEVDLAKHILNPEVLKERITWGRPVRDPDYKFTRYLCNETQVDVNDISILMSHDMMGWNAGSMFFRRSTATDMILSIWDIEHMRSKKWRQNEQTVLTYLAFQSPEIFRRIGTVPQKLINSYYNEPTVFTSGDFVLHFAGNVKGRDDFDKIWQETHESRIRPPPEYRID